MEQKKFRVTFGKVTALLCALTLLLSVLAFCDSSLTAGIESINNQITAKKDEIVQQEGKIAQLQEDITGYQQKKEAAEASLGEAKEKLSAAQVAVTEAENALIAAEAAQDAVCTNYYHSSWYCSAECVALQPAVTEAQQTLTAAKDDVIACENDISDIEDSIQEAQSSIAHAEEDIAATQTNITELKAQIKQLRGELVKAWAIMALSIVAMLLTVGALGLFAKGFYCETVDKFTLFAVGGMAASSLLFFIRATINNMVFDHAPLLYILIHPHTWNLVVMALLAVVLLKKTKKPVVLRNIAIVASVIMGVLLTVAVNPLMGVLYTATVICIAFMIVPLVFTEYICIAKHIFLSLITFGIWQLVWIYHVTKNLNKVEGTEARKPAAELLLCMFLPFFYPYWLYKTAEGVEAYGKENGKEFKLDILCIAFAFVCPLFATVLIQNKINVIVGKPAPVAEEPAVEEPAAEEAAAE